MKIVIKKIRKSIASVDLPLESYQHYIPYYSPKFLEDFHLL